MANKSLKQGLATGLLALSLAGCDAPSTRPSPVPAPLPADPVTQLVAFGNGLYALPDAERKALYATLKAAPAANDTLAQIRLALVAQSIADPAFTADPSAHLRSAAASAAPPREIAFATFLARLLGEGRAAAIAKRCAGTAANAATLRRERDAERTRCAVLEKQIEGLLRLESEMNERALAPAAPAR